MLRYLMQTKKYQDLSSAERSQILQDLVSRFAKPLAQSILNLGGDKQPDLVFRFERKGKTQFASFDNLRSLVQLLHDSMGKKGAEPVGLIYESVDGVVYEPWIVGDEEQIKILRDYDWEYSAPDAAPETVTDASA